MADPPARLCAHFCPVSPHPKPPGSECNLLSSRRPCSSSPSLLLGLGPQLHMYGGLSPARGPLGLLRGLGSTGTVLPHACSQAALPQSSGPGTSAALAGNR